MTGPDDPIDPKDEAQRGVDLVGEAITAQDAGDAPRTAAALEGIAAMGTSHLFAALSIFALVAAEGFPKPRPGAIAMPALFIGNPPRRIDIDSEPAAALVMRLLAATLNDEDAVALDLWRAFCSRLAEMEPGERSAEVSQVLALMVQLASYGKRRALEKAAQAHQRPAVTCRTRRSERRPRR